MTSTLQIVIMQLKKNKKIKLLLKFIIKKKIKIKIKQKHYKTCLYVACDKSSKRARTIIKN